MAEGRITPPRGPMVDGQGAPTQVWLAYLQALADRIAHLETLLTTPPAP